MRDREHSSHETAGYRVCLPPPPSLAGGLDGVRVLGGEGDDALAAPLGKALSLNYDGAGNDRLAGAVFEDELTARMATTNWSPVGAAGAMAVAATIA
jgi:hypothetical protein